MPRGRATIVQDAEPGQKADTSLKTTDEIVAADESAAALADDVLVVEPIAVYESSADTSELDDVDLDPMDLYGDDDDDIDTEESTDNPLGIVNPPKKTIVDNTQVSVTYNGIRVGLRHPSTITLIVPEDGTLATDPDAIIEYGRTFTIQLGQSVPATEEQAAWLRSHPVYDIT